MKKVFLFLMACFLSLTMSAKVAYLLPGNATYNGNGAFSNFDFPEARDGHNQDPEWNAAIWFYKNYVEPNNGDFITIANFAEVCGNYDAIWIHRDLVMEDPLGNANYVSIKTALQNYVKNGGNLLLTKQASALLGSDFIGRVSTEIQYQKQDYDYWGGECKWTICTDFNGSDNSGHAIYKNMMGGLGDCCGKNVEVTWIPGNKHHTDHNCGIPCDRVGCTSGFGTYQSDNACRILGTWGGDCLNFAGVIEFYPKGDWKGTILMIGIAAYQWTYNNVGNVQQGFDGAGRGYGGENVLRITQNALNYLQGSAYWGDGGAPHDGRVGESYICSPLSAQEGYHIELVSTNTDVASFDGGTLTLKKTGTTTIKAIYTGNGMQSCKTELVLANEITVSAPTFTWTQDPCSAAVTEDKPAAQATCSAPGTVKYASSNTGVATIDENTGKMTYLHAGTTNVTAFLEYDGVRYESAPFAVSVSGMTVNWTTAPLESINAGDTMTIAAAPVYGSAVAQYETTNCTYADGKLTFETVGTATVRPYVLGYDDEKFYGEGKTIIVSAPELTWHDGSFPHDGTIGESKPSIWAWLNGKTDVRVQYRSLAPEYISIDVNNYLIYKKPTTGEGVAIEAFVEIGGVEYKLTQMTKSGAPVVNWTTQPAAIAFVTDQVSVAAAVNYGTLPTQYEVSGCTYSDGKLTFSAGGSATVRPYVEAYGERYYGEQKSITVVNPATANPSAATAFLLLGGASALPESERNCVEWFLKGNVQSGTGRFLILSDLSNIPATVKTIIIHADRELVFDFSTCASSLATWVKAGGNLVLMRQATILAYNMGRIDYAPHNEALVMEVDPHQAGMGDRTETDFTSINVCMGTRTGSPALEANSKGEVVVDRSGDDFFNGMTITPGANGQKIIVLNSATRRASNRCFWQEMYYQNPGSGETADYATESRAKFDTFESKYNLQVLAVEAGILDFCLPAIIRFKSGTYNAENWKGSIMAIGAGGFQFNNENQANFELLGQVAESAKEHVSGGNACNNCFTITIR